MAFWIDDVKKLPKCSRAGACLNTMGSWMQFCYDELQANSFVERRGNVMYAICIRGGVEVLVGIFKKFDSKGYVRFQDQEPTAI